jgi:hypothetical protein
VRGRLLIVAAFAIASVALPAQGVSDEYRVKAAYLYNFLKFVEWPADAPPGPLTICVAGRNPFGTVLRDLVRGEAVQGRSVEVRVVLEPEVRCHLLFVPEGATVRAYLRQALGRPMLTVGESDTFIDEGGIASFYIDRGNIRFEISPMAAERSRIRISARLLQLAKIIDSGPQTR